MVVPSNNHLSMIIGNSLEFFSDAGFLAVKHDGEFDFVSAT